jgi:hypothetical protein
VNGHGQGVHGEVAQPEVAGEAGAAQVRDVDLDVADHATDPAPLIERHEGRPWQLPGQGLSEGQGPRADGHVEVADPLAQERLPDSAADQPAGGGAKGRAEKPERSLARLRERPEHDGRRARMSPGACVHRATNGVSFHPRRALISARRRAVPGSSTVHVAVSTITP